MPSSQWFSFCFKRILLDTVRCSKLTVCAPRPRPNTGLFSKETGFLYWRVLDTTAWVLVAVKAALGPSS